VRACVVRRTAEAEADRRISASHIHQAGTGCGCWQAALCVRLTPETRTNMGNTYDTEIARIEADHIQTKWRTTEDYRWGYTGDRGYSSPHHSA